MRTLVFLLLVVPVAMAQEPVEVTACDIIQNVEQLNGKSVAIRAKVIRGPHDAYLVATNCPFGKDSSRASREPCSWTTTATSPESSGCVEFIGLDHADPPKAMGLKKFLKLFFKRAKVEHCTDCFKYSITARFVGVVRKAPAGGFGVISAKVLLNIVDVSDIRTEKVPPPS